ncbi:mycofactocin system transcriptional regulator [Janibacter melonis]|uniref:mycofactocin system transcriptional regulator n=1 Tax=Janibacter melonis TaxID=262209 RepID=UPI001748FC29|nr:mycofactocin system transcriptional regulator [Janibacter melonis]
MTQAVTRGRPAATTHDEIERAAFALFTVHGFESTTLEMIAAELGVARRTVTRYYPSKNDIPWGQFDATLKKFADVLARMPADVPLWQRVHRGVVAFNTFPDSAAPSHQDRMRLILQTPALQAHSVLRYGQWRAVIAKYVAADTGVRAEALLPQLAGHVSLALAVSAYEQWLVSDGSQGMLLDLLDQAMSELQTLLQQPRQGAAR